MLVANPGIAGHGPREYEVKISGIDGNKLELTIQRITSVVCVDISQKDQYYRQSGVSECKYCHFCDSGKDKKFAQRALEQVVEAQEVMYGRWDMIILDCMQTMEMSVD